MPRMSAAEKRKSHERILKAAARLMRERGVTATSVADVMQAADLTHGGFYRHFESKEELAAAAFREAFDTVVSDLAAAETPSEQDDAKRAYLDRYLSTDHVKDRGQGCPFPTMAPELAGLDGAAKTETSDALRRMAQLLAAPESEKIAGSYAILALLVGTITLARVADSEEDVDRILKAGETAASVLLQEGATRTW